MKLGYFAALFVLLIAGCIDSDPQQAKVAELNGSITAGFSNLDAYQTQGNTEKAKSEIASLRQKIGEFIPLCENSAALECGAVDCYKKKVYFASESYQFLEFANSTALSYDSMESDFNNCIESFKRGDASFYDCVDTFFGKAIGDFCTNVPNIISELKKEATSAATACSSNGTKDFQNLIRQFDEGAAGSKVACENFKIQQQQALNLCESTLDCSVQAQENRFKENIFCPKIQAEEPAIRNAAVKIARNSSGAYNAGQLIELFEWMENNIEYVSDPVGRGYIASATETLDDGAGDCEDQAILIVSMIRNIGGTAKLIPMPECQHAFAGVYIGDKKHFDEIAQNIRELYLQKYGKILGNVSYYPDSQGYWLIVDPVGGSYLGDLFPSCANKTPQAIC